MELYEAIEKRSILRRSSEFYKQGIKPRPGIITATGSISCCRRRRKKRTRLNTPKRLRINSTPKDI